jgi:hypothetical protein
MRHIPEAGAVCGNSARTDLRGGQGVTSVPTATLINSNPRHQDQAVPAFTFNLQACSNGSV